MRLAVALSGSVPVPEIDREEMNITNIRKLFLAIALAAMPVTSFAAETDTSGSSSDDMLLLDSLGRVVRVPTNEVPSALQPPTNIGLLRQIPNPTKGASVRVK